MSDPAVAISRTFHALADPNRRAILSVVRNRRCAVGEIADALGLSQQIVSHHLKVLRTAGLVTGSRIGTLLDAGYHQLSFVQMTAVVVNRRSESAAPAGAGVRE